MEWLETIPQSWIAVAAVVLSLIVNLALLGLFLGRRDSEAVRSLERLGSKSQKSLMRLERRLSECEKRHGLQVEEIRRILGRIELRERNDAETSAAALEAVISGPRLYGGIDKKHHVYRLARRGLDSEGIARRLNMYRGEAELVLGLKQFMASRSTSSESRSVAG